MTHVLQERTDRPQGQPRLQGLFGKPEDRTGRHQVLRQHRQPQDRHREPGHRRRVAQPVAHRHRGPARQPEPRRARRPRRRDALHRVQLEHHARRHPRAEVGRCRKAIASIGRPRRVVPMTSTRAPTRRRTRLSRKASTAPTRRSRTSTATKAGPWPRPRSPSPTPASRRRSLLNLQYNPDHYGVSSSEEYAAMKGQLDGRPVPGQPAVHRMGDLHRRTRQGRVPDLPARLVPGLPGRRQLPDAVLHAGQLPGQPLREPGDHRAHHR